ncbi:hypothetical protein KC866_01235 [Patescibacteria group bacterium]|nr:hypothetical protein [Patescibacteria group bacterium]
MKNSLKQLIAIMTGIVVPVYAFAATKLRDVAIKFVDVIGRSLIPLLFSIALALFIWGIVDFIRGADNSETRRKGRQRMLWGILGLLAMIGYISLATVLTNTFFGNAPGLPQLKGEQ